MIQVKAGPPGPGYWPALKDVCGRDSLLTDTADARPRGLPYGLAVRGVAAELAADRPVFLLIGAYALVAAAVATALGGNGLSVAIYIPVWLKGLLLFASLWVLAVEAPAAVRADPAAPVTALVRRVRARLTPRFLAGVALYLALGVFYGAFTLIKTALPRLSPFTFDARLADLDAALHFGVAPWRLLQPALGHHAVTRALEATYSIGWMVALFSIPLLICSARRFAWLRRRFLLTFMASWVLLGNVAAAAFMSGGPLFYGALTGDHARYAELTGYLAFSHGLPNSVMDYRDYLWAWYEAGRPGVGTGISAFPSLHVAMATLFALTVRRLHPPLAWAGYLFLALILAGSVHLGWHYAVDGYASILAVLLTWKAAAVVSKPAA